MERPPSVGPPSSVGAPDYTRKDFPHSPLVLFYEVTQACDLICQHCRACAQPAQLPGELSPEQSLRLMDQIATFPKPPLVVLTGGDPLKRPDLFEMVRYARQLDLKVAITPSATPLVTGEALDELKEAGIVRLAISLDGATAESHDALRGVSGSFQRTMEILRDAQERGIPTQVNSTLTQLNLNEIDAMADLITPFGIALWSVFFLIPVGRGAVLNRLTAEQCEEAFAKLWDVSRSGRFAVKTTEAPHYRRFLIEEKNRERKLPSEKQSASKPLPRQTATLGVNDGKGVMFVGYKGNIFPTGFLPLECGQFPQESVVATYQNSKTFIDLRNPDLLEGKCGICEYRSLCGGSRARSYALTGNLFASEPDCVYQPGG